MLALGAIWGVIMNIILIPFYEFIFGAAIGQMALWLGLFGLL